MKLMNFSNTQNNNNEDLAEESTNVIDESRSFYNSIIEAISRNVDPQYIKSWKPAKALSFLWKAKGLFSNNKKLANQQAGEIKQLLTNSPIYLQAVQIAQDVYSPGSTSTLEGGWNKCIGIGGVSFIDDSTGLVSALYSRVCQGKKEYIYATAGTNPKSIADWKNNVDQLYGASTQYKLAQENALYLAEIAKSENASLMFVGHSLGGGMAINNALHTGFKAIVFNPAGVSMHTLTDLRREYTSTEMEDLITTFLATNDILNWFQDTSQEFDGMKMAIPASVGKRYYLYRRMIFPMRSHSIERMVDNMKSVL